MLKKKSKISEMKLIRGPVPSLVTINKMYETIDVAVYSMFFPLPPPLNSYCRDPGSFSLFNVLQSYLLPAKSTKGKKGFLGDIWY